MEVFDDGMEATGGVARERIGSPPMRDLLPLRQPLLFQPFEIRTPFSFSAVVEETRAAWFPSIEDAIEVRIAAIPALAAIYYRLMGPGRHIVVFHPVLNRPGMPMEVVRFIAKHELTHIVHPGATIDGRYYDHPPSFWAHEYEVGPERFAAWKWLHANLSAVLLETRWGLRVPRAWRRREPEWVGPYMPHLPFEDVPWNVLCPGGGAQLRFLPEWAAAPAPMESSGFALA